MGLDMYLRGHKYSYTGFGLEDGFQVNRKVLELGYWRKHPNLHGYIVQNFADGKDDCQEIELSEENILNIIEAIKRKSLPETNGFFFGSSHESYDNPSIEILEKALEWLRHDEKGVFRSVIYQASW